MVVFDICPADIYFNLARAENANLGRHGSCNCRRRPSEDLGPAPDCLLLRGFDNAGVDIITTAGLFIILPVICVCSGRVSGYTSGWTANKLSGIYRLECASDRLIVSDFVHYRCLWSVLGFSFNCRFRNILQAAEQRVRRKSHWLRRDAA